ncbi:MAG: helix-turn-helix transcriptional regulator [Dorea sp.]|nr:helix-turn-helix transcriptional regulator [Dorea sp.]
MIAVEEGHDTLGKNIKNFREARNLSQSQLAERLWIDRSSLSGYEIGKRTPDIYMLCRIADELKLSLDELVGRKAVGGDGK